MSRVTSSVASMTEVLDPPRTHPVLAELDVLEAAVDRLVKTAQALHGGAAGQLVAHVDEVTPPHEGLRSVLAAGDVSAEHVAVVTDTLSQLPDALEVVTRDEAEALLVEGATRHDPKALAHLARHLLHALDPDASDKLSDEEEQQVQTWTSRCVSARTAPVTWAGISIPS